MCHVITVVFSHSGMRSVTRVKVFLVVTCSSEVKGATIGRQGQSRNAAQKIRHMLLTGTPTDQGCKPFCHFLFCSGASPVWVEPPHWLHRIKKQLLGGKMWRLFPTVDTESVHSRLCWCSLMTHSKNVTLMTQSCLLLCIRAIQREAEGLHLQVHVSGKVCNVRKLTGSAN